VKVGADYNETAKFTPGFNSSNSNAIGDSKSGWRGFQDGQFNITFDGIPFGDANDPTHHSAAYFPASFLSRVTVDRSPGGPSQAGYAPFGGTLGLWSLDLSDKRGASVQQSAGNFRTFTTSASVQSGYNAETGTRALVAFSHIGSGGQLQFGDSSTYQGLVKVEKIFGEVKVTALATGGTERYNNVNSITWPQFLQYGKNYGQVNNNPNTQQYVGYNNSLKATDLEYVKAEWNNSDVRVDNTLYTYSYWYPRDQTNGQDQSIESGSGALTTLKFPAVNGTTYNFAYIASTNPLGVKTTDVTGYGKINSYRAYGDMLNIAKDVKEPGFSGTFRTGIWTEYVDNDRRQQYIDYTTGVTYDQMNL
jgi:iron complex outermembrane receptor protein